MPLYEYICQGCGRRQEHIAPMDEREVPVKCEVCGKTARFVVSSPRAIGLEQERGYYDEGLGEWVKSKAHADEIGKVHGLVRRESRTGYARSLSSIPSRAQVSPSIRMGKRKEESFNAE